MGVVSDRLDEKFSFDARPRKQRQADEGPEGSDQPIPFDQTDTRTYVDRAYPKCCPLDTNKRLVPREQQGRQAAYHKHHKIEWMFSKPKDWRRDQRR